MDLTKSSAKIDVMTEFKNMEQKICMMAYFHGSTSVDVMNNGLFQNSISFSTHLT